MYHAIAGAILVLITSFSIRLWQTNKHRKKSAERKKHTYLEIATKFHLWDDFVNFYYEEKEEMDYDTFTALSTEQKLRMLSLRFGPEK